MSEKEKLYDLTILETKKQKYPKWTAEPKQKLIDTENRSMVNRGEGFGRWGKGAVVWWRIDFWGDQFVLYTDVEL